MKEATWSNQRDAYAWAENNIGSDLWEVVQVDCNGTVRYGIILSPSSDAVFTRNYNAGYITMATVKELAELDAQGENN